MVKSSSQWFAKPRHPVRVRGARPLFHSIGYERASSTRLLWKQEQPGAAPGYPTNLITKSVRSSMAEHQSHSLKRAGSTPAGPAKLTNCLVAQSVRAFAFEAKGWRCESARGCHFHFHAHVVQQQRHPPQKRSSAGASPAMGTISMLL